MVKEWLRRLGIISRNAAGLKPGTETTEGVYAGLTPDRKYRIYAMPTDLGLAMTFNDAAKAVERLNASQSISLGHHDWQIGSLDVMRVVRKNQDEGALKGTFNTTKGWESDCYWSSTDDRVASSYARYVEFLGIPGKNDLSLTKDHYQINCRPVRLVPVAKN